MSSYAVLVIFLVYNICMIKSYLTKQQKSLRMGEVEYDIIEHFATSWGTNATATIRRIIREFYESKDVEGSKQSG